MIMILINTFKFLFPFLKELFLAKEDKENAGKLTQRTFLRNAIRKSAIAIGLFSVLLNVYLIKQIYIISKENIRLNKPEIKIETPVTPTPPKEPNRPPDPTITPVTFITVKSKREKSNLEPESIKKEYDEDPNDLNNKLSIINSID